jgi:hypothetical protein
MIFKDNHPTFTRVRRLLIGDGKVPWLGVRTIHAHCNTFKTSSKYQTLKSTMHVTATSAMNPKTLTASPGDESTMDVCTPKKGKQGRRESENDENC